MLGDLTVEQQLEDFWRWRPPILIPRDHTKSAETRLPTHYDMHLHERLILKRIEPLPSLLTDLKNVVDKAVDAARPNLPEIKMTSEFPRESTRNRVMGKAATELQDEEGVTDFYMNTTAKFCLPVASMLGLQHPEWQSSLIWDKKPPQKASAIADGFLKIDTEVETVGFLRSPLKQEIKTDLQAIAQAKFLHLAVWEFKNLLAGSMEVMRAIDSLKGPFNWLTCREEAKYSCGTDSKHLTKGGKLTTTGSPMGFDALKTPWDINKKISRSHKRKSRLNPDEDDTDYEDDGDYDDDMDYSPSGDVIELTELKKAHHIIQQAWAEAVRSDATILVLNSGNHEFIGVRHRDSQTLFLSPLIEVQRIPAYAKLHTGLYIAAFHDTVCRALQLRDAKTRPPTWTRKYYPDEQGDEGQVVSQNEILHHARRVEAVLVRSTPPPSRNRIQSDEFEVDRGVYLSRTPVRFMRHQNDEALPGVKNVHLGLTFVEALRGITCTAKLTLNRVTLKGNVIVRLARSPADCAQLRREYSTIICLTKAGVPRIVKTLGLFEHSRSDGLITWIVLVMVNAGPSLTIWRKPLTDSQRNDVIDTLEQIHRAGYLHRNLHANNLCIDGDGEVSIVGFGRAIKQETSRSQEDECFRLREILR